MNERSTSKHRLNIALSTDNPLQQKTWKILSQVSPGKRTKAICEAVCGYRQQQDFLEAIRGVIREELQAVSIRSNQSAAESEPVEDDAVLSFIRSLQAEE